jgi:hypothetical protein
MQSIVLRGGRWPLALMLAALAACAEDPAAPNANRISEPNATLADPFTVANTNDNGIGSLRWVLGYATGGETIRFDSSLAGQTIRLDSTLKVRKPVTIEGPGGKGIILTAANARVVDLYTSGLFTLRNLTITGANVGSFLGAAIGGPNGAELVLENSTITGNQAASGSAIWGMSKATLINTTVSGNASTTYQTQYAAVMAGNNILVNSTVANNGGSGVGTSYGSVVIRNSILSGNEGKNCIITGSISTLTREGANVSDDDTCGGPADITIADPKLGPLADNGGPTLTHALMAGSPAINAGVSCGLAVDQRYFPRDAQCDIGAYEFNDFTTVTLTIDPGAAVNQSNGWAIVTGTIKCSRTETFSVAVQLEQQQKTGKDIITVDAAAIVPVTCTTDVRPFIASMVLTSGSFTPGYGDVKAQTVYQQPWVKAANAVARVKMYWARRS